MKRMTALLAVFLLLCGCAAQELSRYPYISQEQASPRARLTLLVGQQEWLVALGGQLSEVAALRSGGAVSLQVSPVEDAAEAFANGEGDLRFVSTDELVAADDSLAFLQLPFLFAAPADALAYLNGEESPIAGSAAVAERYGTLLGAYYDDSWCMALQPTLSVGEVFRTGRFGADQKFPDRSCYLALGAEDTAQGDAKRLMQLLAEGELSAVELLLQELPEQQGAAVCLSRHRIEAQFLFIRQGAAAEETLQCLRQTFSETVTQAAAQRLQQEEAVLTAWGGTQRPREEAETLYEQMGMVYRSRGGEWLLPAGMAERWCR